MHTVVIANESTSIYIKIQHYLRQGILKEMNLFLKGRNDQIIFQVYLTIDVP